MDIHTFWGHQIVAWQKQTKQTKKEANRERQTSVKTLTYFEISIMFQRLVFFFFPPRK